MPSNKLVVALAIAALAGAAGPAASARAGGNGNGPGSTKQPGTSWYGSRYDETQCIASPAADECAASGTIDFGTFALHSTSALGRSVPATGREHTSDVAYIGQEFTLNKPAKSVTATLHFTGVTVDPSTSASSPDNVAYALAAVGGSITDSGCATFGCGSKTSQSTSYAAAHTVVAGVDTTSTHDQSYPDGYVNPAADQTVTVTLSMPDGSMLPTGKIRFAGYTFAYSSLSDAQCTGPISSVDSPVGTIELPAATPNECVPDTPHTGSATATISATLASISYSVVQA